MIIIYCIYIKKNIQMFILYELDDDIVVVCLYYFKMMMIKKKKAKRAIHNTLNDRAYTKTTTTNKQQ